MVKAHSYFCKKEGVCHREIKKSRLVRVVRDFLPLLTKDAGQDGPDTVNDSSYDLEKLALTGSNHSAGLLNNVRSSNSAHSCVLIPKYLSFFFAFVPF